jgi:CrcB protein
LLLRYLLVLCGGGVGSLARYLVTRGVNEHTGYTGRFPLATFLINVTGSFFIGVLMVLLDRGELMHPNMRPLLVTGVLGGFTTFSAFEWEIFALGRTTPFIAFFYCVASVVAGFGACWCGAMLARRV